MSEKAQAHFVEINGIPIYYVEAGEGPPLVFIHGWSLDLTYWKPQMTYFSAQYHVFAYDYRGSGKSGGAEPPFDLMQMVEELVALLAELGIERPILCGHSLGGDIALQCAVTYPDTLSALIIIDSPWFVWKSRLTYYGIVLGIGIGKLLRLKPPQKLLVPFCRFLFYTKKYEQTHPEAIAAWEQQFLSNSVPGLINSGRAWGYRENISEQVSALTIPTLIIRGEKDRIVSQREVENQHRHIPGSQLHIIESTGHMSFEEKPVVVNRVMETFLSARKKEKR